MKRLLIIGASILQLPAILKAKEMGLYVGVADFNPHAIGVSHADEYFNVSTIDEEEVYRAGREFKADGIVTLATDMPMRAVAYATHKLGLVGISYDTAIKATDKGEMIKAFEVAGVEHPWYYILHTPEDLKKVVSEITYPCISKPVDNAGSRGVVLIESSKDLENAIQYSSLNGRNGGVIIEEYLKGSEVSVEVMVVNEDVHILQVTDKLTTGSPHFVEMGHSQPSLLDYKDIRAIKDLAKRAVSSIGINHGPAHVEIMLTDQGPKMIELGARMGGDCITTHLVPLSTGIDMVKATIQIALGECPSIAPRFDKGAAIRYIEETNGVIENISGIDKVNSINGIEHVVLTKAVGDVVNRISSSVDRIGYVISQADTAQAAIDLCENAMKHIVITTK